MCFRVAVKQEQRWAVAANPQKNVTGATVNFAG
jgi:hypothetical protein